MEKGNFDLIVVGSGPAGYSAAVRASQMGARVLLVERSAAGGTCLNWGCIPTKFLWEALHLEARIKKASNYGIIADLKAISFPDLTEKKNKTVELLSRGVKQLMESHAVTVIEGTAAFSATKAIDVISKNGVKTVYFCDKYILATGSSPTAFPGYAFDHDKIIDSTDALNLKEVPKTLLIIGGGAIGVEFASIFARLGSSVTLVEKEIQLLPGEDPELADAVKKSLQRDGVKVNTGAPASFEDMAKNSDKLLIATGRRSNAALLNLEQTAVRYSNKGIEVNKFLETSQKGIYAAGDVTGNFYLAYTAQAEGVCAAENAMGTKIVLDHAVIPKVVFSNPPAASVGIANLNLKPGNIITGSFAFAASSRAFIESERRGWVKIIAEKVSGKIIGGMVLGTCAEELITVIAIAIKHRMTLHNMTRELFFHPSLSEAIHCACEDALAKCVDLPKKI